MSMDTNIITYNAELKFATQEDESNWTNLLDSARSAYNRCAGIITESQVHIDIKSIHHAVYDTLRKEFPSIPSQGIIKIYKECLAAFRSIKSNGHVEHKVPAKKKLSMRLDKRLYNKLTVDGIYLTSGTCRKRVHAELVKYDKLVELFGKYTTTDPLVFSRNGKMYLSISFNVPAYALKDETCIGIDLGERRFAVSSDGIVFHDAAYNAQRRKLRYLKRCLQAKGTKSARKHSRRVARKERNRSNDMCHKVANDIIRSTNASIIVMEDLSKIKQKTSKTKEGFNKTSHNRRMAQLPFYKLKQYLSYKALLANKRVETVSPFMTSRADCLTGKPDGTRKNRRYYSKTGVVLDADWNAAINIARKSKHPFSFVPPLDGGLKTWRAGCLSTTQSYVNPEPYSSGITSQHPLGGW